MRSPDELRPWEFTREVFGTLSPEAFGRLVEDVRRRGIRVPVDIDPGDRILCGHERTRAARTLGIQVPCRVVVLEDELAYREYALADNLLRRQLTPSEQARVILMLEEIERRRRTGSTGGNRTPVREEVGKRIGLSGRQAGKYTRIARLPGEVQEMVDRGEVSVEAASALASAMKGRGASEIIQMAGKVKGLPAREAITLIRNMEACRPAGVPEPASGEVLASLWMGLEAIATLEDVDPASIIAACSGRGELTRLSEMLGRAHTVIVKIRQEAVNAMAVSGGLRRRLGR